MTMLLIIAVLFLGGVVAWLAEGYNRDLPRWITVATCLLAGLIVSSLFFVPSEHELLLAGTTSTWIEDLN